MKIMRPMKKSVAKLHEFHFRPIKPIHKDLMKGRGSLAMGLRQVEIITFVFCLQ